MANLTYLIDKGWINKSEVQKTIRVKGGSVPSIVTWYEISASGIDKIEGESEFQQDNRFAGLNLSVSGINVVTLGDGNVVNAKFEGLREVLDELKTHVVSSSKIEEPIKLDFVADVESVKDQLAKNSPNKTVIKKLWEQIEKIATISGAVGLIQKIVPIIASIVG